MKQQKGGGGSLAGKAPNPAGLHHQTGMEDVHSQPPRLEFEDVRVGGGASAGLAPRPPPTYYLWSRALPPQPRHRRRSHSSFMLLLFPTTFQQPCWERRSADSSLGDAIFWLTCSRPPICMVGLMEPRSSLALYGSKPGIHNQTFGQFLPRIPQKAV